MCHSCYEKLKKTNKRKEYNYLVKKESEHLEKHENYEYLGIIEADIKQVEMKVKIRKELLR